MFSVENTTVIVGLKEEYKVLKGLNVNCQIAYGPKNSEVMAKKMLKKTDIFISFGFAASITTNLKNANIVIPNSLVWSDGSKHPVSKECKNSIIKKIKDLEKFTFSLTSVEKIISSEKEKKIISKRLSVDSLDMESVAIQKIAIKNNKKFVVVRVILDDLKFQIPNIIKKNTNDNGELNLKKLLIEIAFEPKNLFQIIKLSIYYLKALKKLKILAARLFNH
ncbi:hypothetical protein OA848_03805 [Rickettsiales bacterium]|nr:hypothetical protein [Rickettsiales bacterium]